MELPAITTLTVIAHPAQNTAHEAVVAPHLLQSEFLIELDDVAWATKAPHGKMKLHQGTSLTGIEDVTGALATFGGTVIKTNLATEQEQALQAALQLFA